MLPQYSPEGGISEWGQGWRTQLALTRWSASGDIDYATDDLSSPWGRLRKGSDGDWYPDGLPSAVRIEPGANDTFVAYLPDGEQWTFGGAQRVTTTGGTYEWLLTDAKSAAGQHTMVGYLPNASGRRFVSTVRYGGWGSDYQYELDYRYEQLPTPLTAYIPGKADTPGSAYVLDQRIAQVVVSAKNATTGTFLERWRYSLAYLEDPLGPAFFLSQVTQTFASGESPPPVAYTYSLAANTLQSAQFTAAPKLSDVLQQFGEDLVQADGSTVLDFDHDGRPDLEERSAGTLLLQKDGDFSVQPLPPAAPGAFLGCRPEPSPLNPPRPLAQLRTGDDTFQVVDLEIGPTATQTTLHVCHRDGSVLGTQAIEGMWQLGPTTRLADVNRDHQPDLVQVVEGQYSVLQNTSNANGFAFTTRHTGQLQPSFVPLAAWLQDFNGDGLPDLVARSDSSLTVWSSVGNFQFALVGQVLDVLGADRLPIGSLGNYQVQFLDANRDGLTDLLLTDSVSGQLFINNGHALAAVSIPALETAWNVDTSQPAIVDLAGTGNTELLVTQNGQAKSLSLDGPGVALLETADDGKGTSLKFSYQNGVPTPGIRHRPAVLADMTVTSSGYDPVTYSYTFAEPYVHTIGQFLVGFGEVTKTGPVRSTTTTFLLNDDISGVSLKEESTDALNPGVISFSAHEYAPASLAGIPWMQRAADHDGWSSTDGSQSLQENTFYQAYEANVCPSEVVRTKQGGTLTTTTTRATVAALSKNLHCLAAHEVQRGVHDNSRLDFQHEQRIDRNAAGLVQKVTRLGGLGPLTVQGIGYNTDNTIASTSSPATGTTTYGWDPKTHLLQKVSKPDGSTSSVVNRDAASDQILEIADIHGTLNYAQSFRYDGQDRLSKQWDSIGAGSEAAPDETFGYRYATPTQPGALSTSTVVDFAANSVAQAVDLETATGSVLAHVRALPEGWSFDTLTTEVRSLAQTNHLTRAPLAAGAGPMQLDYGALLAGARVVDTRQSSLFGFATSTLENLHSDVARRTTAQMTLSAGALHRTDVENGTLSTVSTLDASQRMTGFDDQSQVHYGYEYDTLGRLRGVSLPDGTSHRIDVDDYGRDARVTRDGLGAIDYTYDATSGLLLTVQYVDAQGQENRRSTFSYDSIGRKALERDDLSEGGSQTFQWFYDGSTPSTPNARGSDGFLTAIAGGGFVKLFKYRADGRLSSRTTQLTGWRTIETALAYTENGASRGHTTTLRDAHGAILSTTQVEDSYDADGRVEGVSINATPLASLAYDSDGLVATVSLMDGSSAAFTYDPLTRSLLGFKQTTPNWVSENSVRYDTRGFIGAELISVASMSAARAYSYSPRGFLTGSDDPQGSYRYDYDGANGLLSHLSEPGTDRAINRKNGKLSAGTLDYELDSLGRVTNCDGLALTYGPNGQVVTAVGADRTLTFEYDEGGQRLVKVANGQPVAAYLDDGYLNASGIIEPLKVADIAIGVVQNGIFQMVPLDRRGTLLGDTDAVATFPSPYGDRATHPSLSAAIDYVLKGWDEDLGTVRMGVRDYDPRIGQFWSADPLFLAHPEHCRRSPVECNLYGYAANNPALALDPTGQAAEWVHVTLNVASFIPVVGNLADAAHAVVYATEGEWAAAALSAAVAIPIAHEAGEVLKAEKLVASGVHVAMVAAEKIGAHGAAEVAEKVAAKVEGEAAAKESAEAVKSIPSEAQAAKAKRPSTLEPGPHAGESIPARGPERDFTPQERESINKIGGETGCHTCGSPNPGTTSGNFVPDHQPPSKLAPPDTPQRLYPQCLRCSQAQGGDVRQALRP